MSINRLRLDSDTYHLHLGTQSIRLTNMEFEILRQLMNCNGGYVERKELLRLVWGPHISVEIRTVDSHVVRLRKKLMQIGGSNGPTIETVWGLGYRVKY
ncbi:MAG: winged helix-turn-helix domain-containing protein [Nitrospirales bacterium]